jgi:hypothetical protein
LRAPLRSPDLPRVSQPRRMRVRRQRRRDGADRGADFGAAYLRPPNSQVKFGQLPVLTSRITLRVTAQRSGSSQTSVGQDTSAWRHGYSRRSTGRWPEMRSSNTARSSWQRSLQRLARQHRRPCRFCFGQGDQVSKRASQAVQAFPLATLRPRSSDDAAPRRPGQPAPRTTWWAAAQGEAPGRSPGITVRRAPAAAGG